VAVKEWLPDERVRSEYHRPLLKVALIPMPSRLAAMLPAFTAEPLARGVRLDSFHDPDVT
jgi:hypothetical protein